MHAFEVLGAPNVLIRNSVDFMNILNIRQLTFNADNLALWL